MRKGNSHPQEQAWGGGPHGTANSELDEGNSCEDKLTEPERRWSYTETEKKFFWEAKQQPTRGNH